MIISFTKQPIRKGKDMIIYSIYKNHPVTTKQVVIVVDLGYRGVEKDYPEQLSALPYKKETKKRYLQRKKSITEFILKRG
jgi:hypothetical protein